MVGYIKLFNDNQPKKGIIGKNIVLPLMLAYVFNLSVKVVMWKVLKNEYNTDWFINYISPFILWFSIGVFIFFSDIKIKNERIEILIKKISCASFSVYIIHCHKTVFDYVFKDAFKFINNYNGAVIILVIIMSMIGIYVICMLLDQIRVGVFYIFRINKLVDHIGNKMDKKLNN